MQEALTLHDGDAQGTLTCSCMDLSLAVFTVFRC